jgi:putative oxidoreductase
MSDTTVAPKLYFPGLAGLYAAIQPYGYPVIRFAAGATLLPHGWSKLFGPLAPIIATRLLGPMGFPAPLAWAYFIGLLEFVGAAMLALGLFTRPIAAMLTVEMAIISFVVLFPHGFGGNAQGAGYEFSLVMMAIYLGIFMRGSDRCSIDRMIGREF